MIVILGKQLLVNMNLSDHVLKNSNARAPRPAVSFSYETQQRNRIYRNETSPQIRIKTNSAIRPIDQMAVTINNTRLFPKRLLHAIVNNIIFSCRKESIQL